MGKWGKGRRKGRVIGREKGELWMVKRGSVMGGEKGGGLRVGEKG